LKKHLREKLLEKRDRIGPGARKKKEAAVRKRLYAAADFRKADSILFYASFRSEADTISCIRHALDLEKEVLLPRVEKAARGLRLFRINSLDDLESGYMDIPEPKIKKNMERKLKDIDMVIVPGAGFDTTGNRLGYGAGYYDRLLKKGARGKGQGAIKKTAVVPKPLLVALAFEEQIVRKIPAESHDVRMDKIITEKRTINCKKGAKGSRGRTPEPCQGKILWTKRRSKKV